MIIYDSDLKIFLSTKINDINYFSGFATKDCGDAKEIENILNFFAIQNIAFRKLVILRQIHSTNIRIIQDEKSLEKIEVIEDCDAVITKKGNYLLTVRNADCVPIIFVDKKIGLIGISHQGWRGSLKKLASKMVEKFKELGSKIENLICAIGPAINDCCYDIDDDRYYSFLEEFDGYSNKIFHSVKGKRYLNLARLNYLLLLETGVKKDNIDFFPFCTSCDDSHFFSKRRARRHNFSTMFNFVIKLK